MKTEKLVEALSRDAGSVPRGIAERRIAMGAAAGLTVALALVPAAFGFRSDLGDALPALLLKAAFGIAAAAAATPLLLELVRPNVRVRQVTLPALAFAALSVAIAVVAFLVAPPEARAAAWLGGGVPECLYRIPVLAIPIAAALFLAVRGLGATRLSLAGAAIGAVSGSLAAIAYASCCPMDSALYVATWYLAAILFCAAVGAVVIGRALKW